VDKTVAKLHAYTVLREEVKYRLITGFAALRQYYLTIGEQLAAEQIIPDVEDVFFLTRAELRALADGRVLAGPPGELIAGRKAQYQTYRGQHAPELVLSRADSVEQVFEGDLLGIPCSPGVVEGTACVLHDLSELERFRPGSILVAPHTDPGWTPLFLSCTGLVTEIGGILSHGATVAREYGIPAVVNVRDATQIIQDGDRIRLDGDRGQIAILGEMEETSK
jgi:pyruvate,water dikinase